MNLPDEIKLAELTREQLIKLCEHFWFAIKIEDIVRAIYEVELDQYFKDIDKANAELTGCTCPANANYSTLCAHIEKRRGLQKKWDRVNKRFDLIVEWYDKKKKERR